MENLLIIEYYILRSHLRYLCGLAKLYRIHINDLVCFTARVLDTSDTSVTRATQVQHECNRSNINATRVTQVRHECNTSAIQKKFDFVNERLVF